MKANEFVKKFGLDYTVELLNDNAWSLKQCMAASLLDDSADDLKRLVESHELVKDYYGLTRAKEHAESRYTAPELKAALKQAIADVESCL